MRPLQSIQLLRAAAATMVTLFHVQGELRFRGFHDPFFDLRFAAFGVDLFFVVSGFIMVYASAPLFGAARASATFLERRIVRIVPLYWLFTALWTAIAVILARDPGHPPYSIGHGLASFLFIPYPRPGDGALLPVDPLGWTLNYEAFFYACFSLAIVLRRNLAVLAVSSGLTLSCAAGAAVALPMPLAYWADPIVLEFVFGMLVAQLHLAGYRLPMAACVLLGAAAVPPILLYVAEPDAVSSLRGLAWGLPATGLLAASVLMRPRRAGRVVRALARLGDASYSLYLGHSVVFIVVFAALTRVADPHAVPPVSYAGGIFLLSIAAALASYRWFERPAARYLRSKLQLREGAAGRSTVGPAA